MAYSKVRLNGNTLIDLTQDTVATSNLIAPNTAHGADGSAIVGTGVSGSNPNNKTVKFIDYDGTLVYSYTPTEFAALTEMRANPSHTGLTSQGWNWSLSDAKTHVAKYSTLIIGQMYVTDDGKTRLYITLDPGRLNVVLRFKADKSADIEVNWGDGTTENKGSTSLSTYTHTYSAAGDYVITLKPKTGTLTIGGNNSSSNISILDMDASTDSGSKIYLRKILKKVELGSSIYVSNYGFQKNYSLKTVTVPNTIVCGSNVFADCYSLISYTISSSATMIGTSAFSGCRSLLSVSIPKSVEDVWTSAFKTCYSLTDVNFHDDITLIRGSTFNDCVSLKSFVIPDDVTAIDSYAFYDCYSLQKITIPNNVTTIGNYAFQYCRSLNNVVIPSGVTNLGSYTFEYCDSLQSVVIPNTVTTIGTYTFDSCFSLNKITLPNNVTTIGIYAFRNCYSLTSLTIPDKVTSIGNYAFYYLYGMKEYHLLPEEPPTLGTNNFTGIKSDCIIYVPYSSDQSILNAYKTATNWSSYASYMQEEPQ